MLHYVRDYSKFREPANLGSSLQRKERTFYGKIETRSEDTAESFYLVGKI